MRSRLDPNLESKDPALLSVEFQKKLDQLIKESSKAGRDVRFAATLRGPAMQARLWCRSRCVEEVQNAKQLMGYTAPKLASLLSEEFCGLGPPATCNLPGQSWHQWGQAVDIYVVVGGVAVWEGSIAKSVAQLAQKIGMFHSYFQRAWWMQKRHWHVQLRPQETPLLIRGLCDSWSELQKYMEERFEL